MPFKIDDFFTTQEERDDMKKEKVEEIDISLLDQFPNHPFKVLENEDLKKLTESVKDNGILEPIIVRKKDNNRYEIISGHRRKRACELNGFTKIPCLIRDMSDDEAIIYMVDSNMHREQILPSEKAYAYKLKLDAMKHQGIKDKSTSVPLGQKLSSRDLLSNDVSDSSSNIQRYVRLTELIPVLLQYVDNAFLGEKPEMALRPAVEISYLTKDEQQMLAGSIEFYSCTPSHAQSIRLRKLSEEGKLDSDSIDEIMEEEKPNQIPKLKLNESKLREVLPSSITNDRIEEFILKAIKHYRTFLKEKDRGDR
jgi:ParB family chromosome partitioning protein